MPAYTVNSSVGRKLVDQGFKKFKQRTLSASWQQSTPGNYENNYENNCPPSTNVNCQTASKQRALQQQHSVQNVRKGT